MFYCCPFLLALALPLGLAAIVFAMAKFLRIKSVDQLRKVVNDLRAGKPVIAALFQVDTESQRHGGELVAAVLKAHGVREVFTLCGGHISPILTGCEALGIRVFDTRHEVNAVFAADAVARLRQDIGVAAVTAGPGITNSITAMKNAQMAESPLLLLGGASPVLLKGRGALQDIDQQVLLKSLCKFTARVRSVREIVPAIRKAISIAKSGAPGPVFVELPIDVLYPFKTIERETGFSKNPRGLKRLIDFVLRVYISRVFGSAWAPQELGPLPVQVPMPKAEQIDQLVAMVKRAKRPLLLMGSQAMWPPVETAKLAKAVEALGIPVYLGGMSRGLLGANCPLQMRQNRKENLQDADLVILAGAICDFRLSYGRVLNPRSAVVTINRDQGQMLKNHRLFWRSSLAIRADVASTLVQLQQQLSTSFAGEPPHQCPPEWLQQLEAKEAEKEAQNAAKALESSGGTDGGRLNPLMLLRQLEAVLPRDVILVADGGDFVGSAAYIVRPRGPLQWLDPGAFGTLGVGAGFALGAKAVYPDRPVLIIYGDGACGFSLMEFDTFVRHKLPVVALIGNDACWSQIARDQVPWFNSDVACQLAYTNYEQVGKGLGTEGLRLEGPADESQIREKLRLALASGNSVVVNALIGKTDFRAGSISV